MLNVCPRQESVDPYRVARHQHGHQAGQGEAEQDRAARGPELRDCTALADLEGRPKTAHKASANMLVKPLMEKAAEQVARPSAAHRAAARTVTLP